MQKEKGMPVETGPVQGFSGMSPLLGAEPLPTLNTLMIRRMIHLFMSLQITSKVLIAVLHPSQGI